MDEQNIEKARIENRKKFLDYLKKSSILYTEDQVDQMFARDGSKSSWMDTQFLKEYRAKFINE